MDNWYFPRTELAKQYLDILNIGISSNLAIIAPRRRGKTLFVLNDIFTLARKKNYVPVYASLWQNINAPHEGLILALEEAIRAIDKRIPFSRLLKANIMRTSIGNDLIGKLEIEFADSPQAPGNNDLIKLDKLLSTLQKKAKNKTVLLLIDEVQHLATSPSFDSLTHALRTMLDKRQGKVKSIFTGSSRHYMHLLFNESQSPFYHFVEAVPFPALGSDFIDYLSKGLRQRLKKPTSKDALQKAFFSVGQSPYWMMKIISHMVTFNEKLNCALNYVLQLIEAAEGFEELEKKIKPIDSMVFLALTSGVSPFSKELLEKIDKKTSVKGVAANVQRSLQRLIDYQLITQIKKGEYIIEKPGFKRYLMRDIAK